MKKILITGANSYIGVSFENYINGFEEYLTDTIDMKNPNWREYDFSVYDVVFHVAGIAHADVGHVSDEVKKMYYKVNTDLTYEVALKAKNEGVNQFIFMSSLIVYGDSAPMGQTKVIHSYTKPKPDNFYGDSKLQAENKINILRDDTFKVCIVRPPMIYGPNSKGNYILLSKIARKTILFPRVNNRRSVLYVGNLCSFLKLSIDDGLDGIYHPQNKDIVSTAFLVKKIAETSRKKICITCLLNPLVYLASKIPGKIGGMINKAFGSIEYAEDLELFNFSYNQYSFEKTIQLTEEIR